MLNVCCLDMPYNTICINIQIRQGESYVFNKKFIIYSNVTLLIISFDVGVIHLM